MRRSKEGRPCRGTESTRRKSRHELGVLEEQYKKAVYWSIAGSESQGPIREGLIGQHKECGVYSRCSGQPLERFKLERDMIQFTF